MPDLLNGQKNIDIGARLEISRHLLGGARPIPKNVFAKAAAVTPNRYSNWIKGRARPDLTAALAMTNAYPLTLDWIYRGSLAGMPSHLVDGILKHVADAA